MQVGQNFIIQTKHRNLKNMKRVDEDMKHVDEDMKHVGGETPVQTQRKGCLGKFAPTPPAGYHFIGSYPNNIEAVPT